MNRDIAFTTPHGRLDGLLSIPENPGGLVVVALLHPAAHAPALPAALAERHLASLSLELLTAQELQFPDSAHNVPLLADRLLHAIDLLARDADTAELPVGIYAEASVTPAAIRVAARRDKQVHALVCHGGIADLAGLQYLELLGAPLLMLVAQDDAAAAGAFRRAAGHLACLHALERLQGGELPAPRAAAWFDRHLV